MKAICFYRHIMTIQHIMYKKMLHLASKLSLKSSCSYGIQHHTFTLFKPIKTKIKTKQFNHVKIHPIKDFLLDYFPSSSL